MVAPTTGKLKSIIDQMATQLDTIDNLRVYKYPTVSVQEFPAAVIRDSGPPSHSILAEYRGTSPDAVYHLEVLILVDLTDEQEAYEELEKYTSANSGSSIKAIMDSVVLAGVQAVECIKAEPRSRLDFGGASLWGCSFWVRSIVT